MRRNRSLRKDTAAAAWFWTFWGLMPLLFLVYAVSLATAERLPAGFWNTTYGVGAVAFLVGVVAWAVRRRTMSLATRLRLGRSRAWLYFHIYGGCLFLLLVGMHTQFAVPRGPLTVWLWLISIWTVVSGMLGLMLQKVVPRILASGLSTEVLYERVGDLSEEVREQAETLAAACEPAVHDFYRRNMAPLLGPPKRRLIYLYDITGGIRAPLEKLKYLEGFLTDAERARVARLEQLIKTKLEIEAHYTLQSLLRWWLIAHVPTSLLLLVLVGLHLFTVFYY